VKISKRGGADRVQRYNLYYSADIDGNTLPEVSSGDMIAKVERLAKEHLPDGFAIEWTDLTYQQILAGDTIFYIFPLCVIFVFLVLAAQYESWNLPLAIILIVPMCLLSAVGGVWLRGMDNNIFTQIGLVVLVGLAAKNAILIVEFAKQKQDEGMNRFDAAVEACRLRLRPILMTSFAFILGVVPLVLATGAGAEMRQALRHGCVLWHVGRHVLRSAFHARVLCRAALARGTSPTFCFLMMTRSLALFPLLLVGCTVGPRYQEPKPDAPGSFATKPAGASTSAESQWWKRFNDSQLNSLITQAEEHNRDLKVADARLKEARALWTQARYDLLPTANSGAGYSNSQASKAQSFSGTTQGSELPDAGLDADLGTRFVWPRAQCREGCTCHRGSHAGRARCLANRSACGGRGELLVAARCAGAAQRRRAECDQPSRLVAHCRGVASRWTWHAA